MSVELLSTQPQEDGEPVFDAPWQARTFAMAVKLCESGLFSWKEWSDRLSENIALFEQRSTVTNSEDYYSLWQQTLEQFIEERLDPQDG
ncbi:MAG: nitrile hydratase accessory protein [Arenicellales bacterium]